MEQREILPAVFSVADAHPPLPRGTVYGIGPLKQRGGAKSLGDSRCEQKKYFFYCVGNVALKI